MGNNKITLYPSNWLYNAGVLGFLRVLEFGNENIESFLMDNGSVEILEKIFKNEKVDEEFEIPKCLKYLIEYIVKEENLDEWKEKRIQKLIKDKENLEKKGKDPQKIKKEFKNLHSQFYVKFYRAHGKLFGSKTPFQNLVQREEWASRNYLKLISEIPSSIISTQSSNFCDLCGQYKVFYRQENKLEARLSKLQMPHLKELAPSLGEFPNSFWFNSHSNHICLLCAYLILHHREAFIQLSDNSKIFINAPSFKLMWFLNKHARKMYEKSNTIKEILGLSFIELVRREYVQLGKWERMNIEVVVIYNTKVEFFSLPSHIVDLLTDRNIASTLSQIGEFKVLNMVLDGRFDKILEIGERIFKISLKQKNEWSNIEKDFVNENIKLPRNRKNIRKFLQDLFKLYALIREKL